MRGTNLPTGRLEACQHFFVRIVFKCQWHRYALLKGTGAIGTFFIYIFFIAFGQKGACLCQTYFKWKAG